MPRTYDPKIVEKTVKTIPMLAVDAVEKAKAGHPGRPMALASIAFEIWTRHLRYDPSDGASATHKDIQKHFGFIPELVAGRIEEWLG